MSRIAEDVLANLDIVDVVSRYVPLKKVGRNFVGLSPFRNEKTPSFTVSPEKQIFKCFSTGIGGNAIKFIIEMEKIDFRDAIKILAPQANVDISKYEYNKNDKQESLGAEKEKYKLMMRTAQSFFSENLKKSTSSLDYLHNKRQLTDEVIEKFWLGYAPDSHYSLMQLLTTKWFTEQDITTISLGKKWQTGDLYGFYRNRITFPIYDHLGTLIWFGARAIDPNDNPKYLNSSDSPLYDKSKVLYGLHIAKNNIKTYDKLVVVEWYMDVIWLSRLWLDIGVATCGTSLTPSHMKLMKRYTQNLYLLFDGDAAGFDATVRGLKVAYEQDTYPKILSLPEGYKDVDEWANVTPSEENIKDFFAWAEDGVVYVMKKLIEKYDHQSPIERKRIIEQLFGILLYVQDLTMLTRYIEKIGSRLGLGHDVLLQQYKTFTRSQAMITKSIEKNKEEKKPLKQDDELLVASFFYDDFLDKMQVHNAKTKELVVLVEELAKAVNDPIVVPIIDNTVSAEQKEAVLEAQLYRERQRELHNGEKKEREVQALCQKYIQRMVQHLMKLSRIPAAEKQELYEKMKKVLMNK